MLPQEEEFKHLRGKGENEAGDRQADLGGGGSNVDAAPVRCGEERAEPQGEALNVLAHLRPNPQLWSRGVGSDRSCCPHSPDPNYFLNVLL